MKIIKVGNCGVCPYYEWGGSFLSGRLKDDWCQHAKKSIPNLKLHAHELQKRYDIPDWCRLEDLTLNIPPEETRGYICICKTTCPIGCKGECGCKLCYDDYIDFLSAE